MRIYRRFRYWLSMRGCICAEHGPVYAFCLDHPDCPRHGRYTGGGS